MTEVAKDDALRGRVVPSEDELVARWQEADKTEQASTWAKADLALEAGSVYGDVTRFAVRVGVPKRTIDDYRFVAKAWPHTGRPVHLAFGVAKALASQPDRFELVASKKWTQPEARELARSRKAPAPLPKGGEPSPPAPGSPSPRNREPRHAEQAWRNVCQAAELVIKLPRPDFETSEKQRMIRQLEAALKHLREM